MKRKIIILIILYFTLKIFLNYTTILNDVNEITYIFIKNIFPSLFIFFIISSLLVNYGFINIISKLFGKIIAKIFKISPSSSYIFFMSMISGFPSSAKYIKDFLDKNIITNKEGEKLLLFCHFANPLFILSLNKENGFIIIVCHYLSSVITGIIFRNYNGNFSQNHHKNIKIEEKKFIISLTDSIKDIINILLNLLGIIVFFYVLSNLTNINILKYILEMTSSINFINSLDISLKIKILLISGILSFGGICVHMQVFSILEKEKIRYIPYLFSRIISFIISSIIVLLLY